MRDRIELRGLELLADRQGRSRSGAGEPEREQPQQGPLLIDLAVSVDLADAAVSDDIADTIDYGVLAGTVAAVVAASDDLLLERLAGRIADAVLAWPRADEVDVVIRRRRPRVPHPVADAGVRLHRSRAVRGTSATPHRALVALGSNVGDRRAWLAMAINRLAPVAASSQVFETPPVGGPTGQDAFFNMVIAIDTALDPFALLRQCGRIEASAGRVREIHHGARTLDIDLLFYDDVRIDSPELVIPHPRISERRFVLAPLAEVAPARVPERWDELLPPLGMVALGQLDLMA